MAKNCCPGILLSLLSKIFEKDVKDRLADQLEKCVPLSNFQYGFRSSRSTADLLTVVSDINASVFNRAGTTQSAARDISKAFNRMWHAGLLLKLKSYGISVWLFCLISFFSVIDVFLCFWNGSCHKNIKCMLDFSIALFLVLHSSIGYVATTKVGI